MTPQSSFMIVAPIQPNKIGAMRLLLASAAQDLPIPFERLENLHSARLVVLDDPTVGDPAALYGVTRPDPPIYLAFLGDFDGDYPAFLDLLVQYAGVGLREIFSLCEGFSPAEDLRTWMIAHEHRPAAYYCNWVGRTVKQTREEEWLRLALKAHLADHPAVADSDAVQVHDALRRYVEQEVQAGRLQLTDPAPTPLLWRLRQALAWVSLVLLAPLVVLVLGMLALAVRRQEDSAPEFAPRPTRRQEASLAAIEDFDVTNQFSAIGPWKPGWLRALIVPLVLWLINLTARTIYTKGRLTRIHTIHFARWVYLDNRTRVFFGSVYDGSLESYNEDFINKVSIGLNVVFGNGVGYPRTAWLFSKGAKDEQKFKYFLRRHEVPSDVWYNAHAGMTAFDLQRNSEIRLGLQKQWLTEKEACAWVALL